MAEKKRRDTLLEIAEEIRQCTACPLHQTRINPIIGNGPTNAELFFVTEAPVYHEDKQGISLVGSVGRFFDTILASIGFSRDEIFICNVVRCRPPSHRPPSSEEVEMCKGYLLRQIEVIHPQAVIPLGRSNTALFFPERKLTDLHGQVDYIEDQAFFPLFHPSDVLRNPHLRPTMQEDFFKLRVFLDGLHGVETSLEELVMGYNAKTAAKMDSIPVAPPPAIIPNVSEPPQQLSDEMEENIHLNNTVARNGDFIEDSEQNPNPPVLLEDHEILLEEPMAEVKIPPEPPPPPPPKPKQLSLF